MKNNTSENANAFQINFVIKSNYYERLQNKPEMMNSAMESHSG